MLCADIQLENGDNHVQEGVKHMVKFGKGAYEATVILTGSRELCQIVQAEKLEELSKQKQASHAAKQASHAPKQASHEPKQASHAPKQSTQTKQSGLQSRVVTMQIPSSDELNSLKRENSYLKKQLAELEELYSQKGHFISKLESQIEECKEQMRQAKLAYKVEDIEDLCTHSKFTLQLFGKRVGMDFESNVTFTENYPQVTILPVLLRDTKQLLDEGHKSASYIFRKVIGAIISESQVWETSTGAKQLLKKYDSQINAAFEYVSKQRTSYTMKECKQVINQMCAEARRAAKRRNQSANSTHDESTLILDETNMDVEETQHHADMEQDLPARCAIDSTNVIAKGANQSNQVSKESHISNESDNEAEQRDWMESRRISQELRIRRANESPNSMDFHLSD